MERPLLPLNALKHLVLFISATSLFLLDPSSAPAAEKQAVLEEVVVTASRYDENVTEVPANVTVINEERIRNSTARNVAELLRSEVSVNVSDITGNRRYYNVDLRGFGETGPMNTLVLVDGVKVNSPDLSGTDWALIPLDRIQRIEIIRGGRGGVLYGDNASGGVINIITKTGGDKIRAGGELSAGSYSSYNAKAYASGSPLENMPLYLSGGYEKSGGYRDNSALDMKDVGLNMNYLGVKNLRINFATGYHQDYNRLPGGLYLSALDAGQSRTATNTPDDYAKIEDYYFRVTPEYYVTDNAGLKMDISYRNRTYLTYYSGAYGYSVTTSGLQTFTLGPRFTMKNDLSSVVSNSLVTGADYRYATDDIRGISDYGYGPSNNNSRLRKADYGGYVSDELAIARRLFISAGYRWDQAHFTFSSGSPDSRTMTSHAWTAGINYKYLGRSYGYFSYSRSFRYPALDEMYSTWYGTLNSSMKAQTSDSYEIGTRFYFRDDIYAHLNLFRTDTDNEIFYDPSTYSNTNLDGMTRRTGVELSLNARVTDSLTLTGNYTYTDPEIKSGVYSGKQVPNVPRHKVGLEGRYEPFKGFLVVLNGVYMGERPFISDFSNAYPDQKDYVLVNNRYQYKWDKYTVFLNINNLLNQKYYEYGTYGYYVYPSPGINFMGGLKVDI
jgi:iron complex outermembrane receptor protein